jgi:hypothetical protein
MQSYWKTVQQFLTKLDIHLPYNPAGLFHDIYPDKLKTYKTLCINIYRSFIYNLNLEVTTIPLLDEWINNIEKF